MLKAVKESVHRMASHLQLVSDEGNHKGTARAGDESNGVGERDEVRSVDKNEVRAGHGNDNPKTK
jgi:hypothetical protein